ncbi:MAG TPA: AAA family ATPase [Symbiobacteriaceae bacterium]|nr:AAA family ATPase [Symbiobacteriaceae bacterium]
MEGIVVMPSPERGREFVLPLSMGGIMIRSVVQTGNQLVTEITREPADCIFLPETLHDGSADMWLAKVAAVAQRRPLVIVLVYGVEASEAIRERVRSAYGPGVEVVAAGARNAEDVAAEAARVMERLARLMADQDRDAFQRLSQPVPSGTVPQPARKNGAMAMVGTSGGVGTSTLAANMGAYAAMAGQRVLLVDAQFTTTGSLLYYLGTEPDDQNYGMHHLRWNHMSSQNGQRTAGGVEIVERLQEVRLRNVRHAELRVLHVPAILEHMSGTPVEQVTWAIQTLERSFDLVLVDCGSGIGSPRSQKLLEAASQVLIVTGGWGASVHTLVRTLTAMDGRPLGGLSRDKVFLLLREMSEGVYGTKTVSAAANMPVYGRIPEEPLIRRAETRLGMRLPLVVEQPESPYSQSIAQVAYALGAVGHVEAAAQVGTGRSWWPRRKSK